ncbi:MAG: inositol monophosphatase [Actinomycetota bacterium]|nr:inositol monophosphatase [Actinomycetota bacterium]
MTTDDPESLRALAVRVASEAAEAAARMRDDAVRRVHTKSSGTDVVTAADTEVEDLLRRRLASQRPGDAVLGEECGASISDASFSGSGGLCWVIDPIDGTVNYLYGLPWYAVSVAATRGGLSLAGAVVEPASGRVWSAALGQGAELDGRPLRVSAADRLDRALVGTGFSYRAELRARQGELAAALLPRARDIRRLGSAALDLCAVAAGWLDGYYEHATHPWDWAAGALIAAEAGAVVRPPGCWPSMMLAAAPGIADELAAALTELGADAF